MDIIVMPLVGLPRTASKSQTYCRGESGPVVDRRFRFHTFLRGRESLQALDSQALRTPFHPSRSIVLFIAFINVDSVFAEQSPANGLCATRSQKCDDAVLMEPQG